MTHTQANEPGFVLVPCPFCGGLAHSTPEVGGLAALVMCSENDCCMISGATLQAAAAAWNRRAAAAPVEDADAKAGDLVEKYCEGFCKGSGRPGVFEDCTGCEIARLSFPAPTIPSEPEAKGEAGAGPAGEAVAAKAGWNACRKSIYAVCEDVNREAEEAGKHEGEHAKGFAAGMARASKSISRGFNSMEAEDDDHFRAIVYTVEGPNEVDRLTRERDAASEREVKRAGTLRQRIDGMRCEIAEMRENLGRLLAAAGKARTALAGFTSADDAAFALDVAIGDLADWKRESALSTQESSAALAGDGKEVRR